MATIQEAYAAMKTLSLEDKQTLNRMLVEELREEHSRKQRIAGLQFRPGDQVEFETRGGSRVVGTVMKVNPKSVKVVSGQGRFGLPAARETIWNVSPGLLKKVA